MCFRAVAVAATDSCVLNHRISHGRKGRRRNERAEWNRKESGERERGERESLVIYISIPSTACAARQPVCPNKQPAEGGCLIITSPLFSHPGFTFHLTTNTRPRLRLCPLSRLEFGDVSWASKATIHMLFRTRWGQYGTRQRPGRGDMKTQWAFITSGPLGIWGGCPLQPDALSDGGVALASHTLPDQQFVAERSRRSDKNAVTLS